MFLVDIQGREYQNRVSDWYVDCIPTKSRFLVMLCVHLIMVTYFLRASRRMIKYYFQSRRQLDRWLPVGIQGDATEENINVCKLVCVKVRSAIAEQAMNHKSQALCVQCKKVLWLVKHDMTYFTFGQTNLDPTQLAP